MAEDSTLLSEFQAIRREYDRYCIRAEEMHVPLRVVVTRHRADSIKTEAKDIIDRAEKIEGDNRKIHIISGATEIVNNLEATLLTNV